MPEMNYLSPYGQPFNISYVSVGPGYLLPVYPSHNKY